MSELTPRQSRTIGALLGVHVGDALGAALEFRTHTSIRSEYPSGLRSIIGGGFLRWPPGHATDDTDMTRAVLLAYRDHRRSQTNQPATESSSAKEGKDVVKMAADYFVKWLEGDWPDRVRGSRPVDIGNTTANGLRLYKRTRDPSKAGSGGRSAGNGSLMRCIPTALFQPSPSLLVEESIRISRVTHDDPRCTVACAAYNTIVAQLISGTSSVSAVAAGEAISLELEGDAGPVTAAIRRGKELSIADTARDGPPIDMKGKFGGYVLGSLILAVAAVLDYRSLEDVLVDVVRVGHDTDTNGAVAGGLLGSRDGIEGIPSEWSNKLQFADEFRDIALELIKE
ncbi:ADP-ribosylation/Crystallin J1 [Ilyonectria destructans]|nr:ADP-ribosylation/Crystallin J1 [Ilyonectria destructans]